MQATSANESELKIPKPGGWTLGRMAKLFLTMPLWCAAVFASAGRIDWVRGWIWLSSFSVAMAVTALLVRRKNPALLEARSHIRQKDTKPFDKVILAVYLPLTFLQPVVAGLDAARFGWTSMPFVTVYVGLVLLAIAMTPVTWAMLANPFAESTVRIQTDRGQKVVTSGPYRIVRHPMYLGLILLYPAMALILGSMWALAVSGLMAILMVWRTVLEDRTLRRELPGYGEFTTLTRYCLIPGVW